MSSGEVGPPILGSIPSPGTNSIEIGPLDITFYGIAIALGVLAAFWLASRRFEQRGGDPNTLYRIGMWAVFSGLVGARIGFVLPRLDRFAERPLEVFQIWEGGLTLFGGLAAGVAVGYVMARREGVDLRALFDAAASALPLAQAIGRWGNYFNQELFGRPTDLPWGLEIDPVNRPERYAEAELFHPTFLYESLWNLVVVVVLLRIDRTGRLARGSLFLAYLVLYGSGRFALELLRVDTEFRLLGLSRNGWLALAVVLGSVVAVVIRQRRARRGDEQPREERGERREAVTR